MKKQIYIVEIDMPDGDLVSSGWLQDLIQQDLDSEGDKNRQTVSVRAISLPSGLDEAAVEYVKDYGYTEDDYKRERIIAEEHFKSGAEWMAGKYKTLGETEIYLEDDGGEAPYTQEWLDLATTEFAVPEGFKPGDKVIVQIRKK